MYKWLRSLNGMLVCHKFIHLQVTGLEHFEHNALLVCESKPHDSNTLATRPWHLTKKRKINNKFVMIDFKEI